MKSVRNNQPRRIIQHKTFIPTVSMADFPLPQHLAGKQIISLQLFRDSIHNTSFISQQAIIRCIHRIRNHFLSGPYFRARPQIEQEIFIFRSKRNTLISEFSLLCKIIDRTLPQNLFFGQRNHPYISGVFHRSLLLIQVTPLYQQKCSGRISAHRLYPTREVNTFSYYGGTIHSNSNRIFHKDLRIPFSNIPDQQHQQQI